ncbi:lactate/malate dehydrogenase family protein [Blastopirellula sp. JC732]|uniref:Lactate/malate dehydrogenase family protein n=1 Tax=Blastopirellula sediminis TaxID=2894196 RepID=A0A9X1SIG2_9BACT|nr:lactate/malate dehydrogenase family protein [Blastopirellula sediminis]MCC9605127.1 lactate/malate dehydrogenase family protein [Blastopirellula sediminis]MCC9631573.1 lactate/malate dehydrogenase family protein [Blastopirellula sediminis]
MKITIVGTGHVGSAIAFAATINPLAAELLLVNRNLAKAEGEAIDLANASALQNSNMRIRAGQIADSGGSDILIFTASVPYGSPTRKRTELAIENYAILQDWLPQLATVSPDAILIMVSNPVDALTYAAIKLTGYPPERVIGTGTLLDSVRYRALLSAELGIHPDDIRAYILGEHGDTQFAAHSLAMTGGERFYPSDMSAKLFRQTVSMGYDVSTLKGHTSYGIALATMSIVDSIVYDLKHTMPVSVLIDGFLEVRDVCLSLPAVIGRGGVTRVLRPKLSEEEQAAFQRSADAVRANISALT